MEDLTSGDGVLRRGTGGSLRQLSWPEVQRIAYLGVDAHMLHLEWGDPQNQQGSPPWERWQRYIEGCLGEYVFADAIGAPWDGHIEDYKAIDVVHPEYGGFEVRTRGRCDFDLLLYGPNNIDRAGNSKASKDLPYVLLTGYFGAYVCRGWINGKEATEGVNPDGTAKYWNPNGFRSGGGCYVIPQQHLQPLSLLISGWDDRGYRGMRFSF